MYPRTSSRPSRRPGRVPALVPALALAWILTAGTAPDARAQTASPPGAVYSDAVPSSTVVELPTRYAAGRFYVTPVTSAGDTVAFYTDTGGGASMIFPSTVDALGLESRELVFRGDTARLAAPPVWKSEAAIPAPALLPPAGPWMLVRQPEHSMAGDGFLGRTWFAGRVWLFDYPGESLGRVLGYDASVLPAEHRVPLGYQTNPAGRRTTHFPRVEVEVDGESLDLLFDTGATVNVGDESLRKLDDGGPAVRASSFIVRSVYERWRERHPGWRVLEGADSNFGEPMIEVPELSVAGHTVGPVWFAVRPDGNFRDDMSRWMDREIDGALGGSALRYFRVLVDYPSATAFFLRPGDLAADAGESPSGPAGAGEDR